MLDWKEKTQRKRASMNLNDYETLLNTFFQNGKFPNRRISHYSSFAIWNPNDTTDLSVIHDLPETENEKLELKSSVVIIGLNGTGPSRNAGVWRNFHSTGSGSDTRLKKFLNTNPQLRGAYITDLFKTRSEKTLDVKNIPQAELDWNFALLREELEILDWLNAPGHQMIALGKKAYDLLKTTYEVKWIWHPASSKTDLDIEDDIRRLM